MQKEGMIKYARHEQSGDALFIREAENGLACNCRCFRCNSRMIAVQSKSQKPRAWFYRHDSESEPACSGGPELGIHAAAKKIILENMRLLSPNGEMPYYNAVAEKSLGDIVPDVTVHTDSGTVHIEIEVTNPVNEFKKEKYISSKNRCIAIDLSKVDREMTPEDLKALVLDEFSNRRFIYWPDEIKEELWVPKAKSSDDTFEKVLWILFIALVLRCLPRI